VNARGRLGAGAIVGLMVAAPVAAALLVQRDVPEAHAASAPFLLLAGDSASGDSAAFAALPASLRLLFSVRDVIGTTAGDSVPLYECIQMPGRRDDEVRRRLQLRLPDSSAAVLFAVADRARGSIKRVEFLRRIPHQGQRGFIWDRQRDRTTSVWWFEGVRGVSRREERGDIPRGGPVPRAVRGLARQLFVASCADSSSNSPMNPISGSRD
jgi:hypothetical protein